MLQRTLLDRWRLDRHFLLLHHLCVLGGCEAHAKVLAIKDRVELPQEGVSKDEKRALRGWNVESHQADRAFVRIQVTVHLCLVGANFWQTLRGPCWAVSKPIFATKY